MSFFVGLSYRFSVIMNTEEKKKSKYRIFLRVPSPLLGSVQNIKQPNNSNEKQKQQKPTEGKEQERQLLIQISDLCPRSARSNYVASLL